MQYKRYTLKDDCPEFLRLLLDFTNVKQVLSKLEEGKFSAEEQQALSPENLLGSKIIFEVWETDAGKTDYKNAVWFRFLEKYSAYFVLESLVVPNPPTLDV